MKRPIYGQVVVGPPGSGKTTFCDGMQQYCKLLGRNAMVINLDPANEGIPQEDDGRGLPYETLLDVCQEVVNLRSVMEDTGLGPNGGIVYCMEFLENHVESLIKTIQDRVDENTYLIFDLPGQIELYTHSTCVQTLLQRLIKAMDLRLTAVQLVDALYCTDASKFLSAALLSTTTMLRLELPAVNVLSKIDLLSQYGNLDLSLEFYTECLDLDRLVQFTDQSNVDTQTLQEEEEADLADDIQYQQARRRRQASKISRKFTRLHAGLADVVSDFGLLHYGVLDIRDAASVGRVLARIDKSNGFVFTEQGTVTSDMFQCAVAQESDTHVLADVQERSLARDAARQTG
jgi:GTPase SAR1 family protein